MMMANSWMMKGKPLDDRAKREFADSVFTCGHIRRDELAKMVLGTETPGKPQMSVQTRMEWVLEHACRELPGHGGDHQSRKYIAQRLIETAENGATTLAELEMVAHQALQELSTRKAG
jgi:hypothetical protein